MTEDVYPPGVTGEGPEVAGAPEPPPVPGTPEGRPGVWLVSPDAAAALLESLPGGTVHCLLGESVFLGANWPKADAVALVRSGVRLALIFPPNATLGHQLVALGEKRWAFDVGEVDESRMVPEGA